MKKKGIMMMLAFVLLLGYRFYSSMQAESLKHVDLFIEEAKQVTIDDFQDVHLLQPDADGRLSLALPKARKEVVISVDGNQQTLTLHPQINTYRYDKAKEKWQAMEKPKIKTVLMSQTNQYQKTIEARVVLEQPQEGVCYFLDAKKEQASPVFTIRQNGQYTAYVKDAYGQVSDGYVFEVNMIDTDACQLVSKVELLSVKPIIHTAYASFVQDDVIVKVKVADELSGIASVQLQSDTFVVNEPIRYFDGSKYEEILFQVPMYRDSEKGYFYLTMKDCLDNEATLLLNQDNSTIQNKSGFLQMDTSNPTLHYEHTVSPSYHDDIDWYTQLEKISVFLQDGQSGLKKFIVYNQKNEKVYQKKFHQEKKANVMVTPKVIKRLLKEGRVNGVLEVWDQANHKTITPFQFGYDEQVPKIKNYIINDRKVAITKTDKITFFDEAIHKVMMQIEDGKHSSKIRHVLYYLKDFNGKQSEIYKLTQHIENEVEIPLPKDFQGYIYAKAVDHCHDEQSIPFVHSEGIVIQSQSQFEQKAKVDCILPSTALTDQKHHPLYDKEMKIRLVIANFDTGIKKLQYRLQADNANSIFKSYDLTDEKAFINVNKEHNLYTGLELILPTFEDGVHYQLDILVEDQCHHQKVVKKEFSQDHCAPVVSYQFLQGFKSLSAHPQTVKLVIEDIQCNPATSRLFIYQNHQLLDSKKMITIHKGLHHYELIIPFQKEATYQMKGIISDYANHQTTFTLPSFTIDQTPPVMPSTFSIDRIKTHDKPIPIQIVEKHFHPEKMHAFLNDKEVTLSWHKKKDYYMSYLPVVKDGSYTFYMQGEDGAGNRMKTKTWHFLQDSTCPTYILNLKKDDCFYSTPKITLQVMDDSLVERKCYAYLLDHYHRYYPLQQKKKANRIIYSLAQEDRAKLADGKYQLCFRAKDVGNHQIEKRIPFFMNRHGSQYQFPKLKEYNQKVENITILEKSPLPLIDYTIYLSKDGNLEEVAKKDIHCVVSTHPMYTYAYTMSAQLFKENALYDIFVGSYDLHHHPHSNRNQKDHLRFIIDHQKPQIEVLERDENHNAIQFMVKDDRDLDKVKVYVNKKEYPYQKIQNVYHVGLKASKNPYHIKIVALDQAGNKAVKEVAEVYNLKKINDIQKEHKIWVWLVLCGIGCSIFIVFRRKKQL